MITDSRGRISGTSVNKKRRFGRKKKTKKIFWKNQATLTTKPGATVKSKKSTPTMTSINVPKELPSTSTARTPRTTNDPSIEQDKLAQDSLPKSKKKLKSLYADPGPVKNRIIDISLLLPELQDFLACKACGGSIKFSEVDIRGLGSKLSVACSSCNKCRFIDSSRKVGSRNIGYEINRRVELSMRSIGQGHAGLSTFCGMMDLLPPVSHSNFDIINQELKVVSDIVAKNSMKAAMEEDCSSESQENDKETVSGDGSWRKRGFSSLQGVSTLIRYANGKVIDVAPKQSFCRACDNHPEEDTEQYREWLETHKDKCSANHEGCSGKMEVDGMIDMFERSEEKYGVKYKNYIGDGDSKVYKALCDSKPYGEHFIINKKECVGHVQKRMGTRLRNLKKDLSGQKLKDKLYIGGKNRLTAQRIDQLTKYYGNAIRGNCQSVEKMSEAIWATFHHKNSTDKKPTHHYCPPGEKSWCKWQVAKSKNKLKNFHHIDTIPAAIMDVIEPIYKDLTQKDLLKRCIGGFTQNSNESLNQSIWKIVPKHSFSGLIVLEIGVNIAVSCFNDGKAAILEIMNKFGTHPGSSAVNWAREIDEQRLALSEKRALESTLEARRARRKKKQEDDCYTAGGY